MGRTAIKEAPLGGSARKEYSHMRLETNDPREVIDELDFGAPTDSIDEQIVRRRSEFLDEFKTWWNGAMSQSRKRRKGALAPWPWWRVCAMVAFERTGQISRVSFGRALKVRSADILEQTELGR